MNDSLQPRPALLFDLDGTMTDPFVGITRSLQYALERLGRLAPAAEDLRWCIGPPIQSNLAKLLETDDEALIWEGVRLYRERYGDVGKFENRLIPGVSEVLAGFARDGYILSVATSKVKSYTADILEHFGLHIYFDAVHGSEPDGRNSDKTDLIRHILASEPIDAGQTVMIGDRMHDIIGARANGVRSIGVLWGYGDRGELEGAGADRIAEHPDELGPMVREMFREPLAEDNPG
ncbi:HAD hydrolase-like protein [Chelativorans sp. YIM 93263]|uniref:HAD hydrolase-like protein n=1 Tax=Chelativorans sp. YIM 93263 TaxID=2906648 RepID=UPI002377DF4F|nr:HAD hydrolase-like protein [Chelativorans sp. YIM 93263]